MIAHPPQKAPQHDAAVAAAPSAPLHGPHGGIRFRAIAVGVALIWLSARWIFWGEFAHYTFVTIAVPFAHAVFLLLAATVLNLALRRRAPCFALTGLELLAVYAMVSVGSAVMSADMLSILVTEIGYPAYFADAGNRWHTLFSGALPPWLIVTDREAAAGFFRGSSSFWTAGHMRAWLVPLAAWTAFAWALVCAMHCLCAILRKAWAADERLTFPILALPVALATEPGSLFRSRLWWLGFAVAGGITLLNGLSYLYPAIPSVPIKRQYYDLIQAGPMAGAANVTIAFYFFGITLGFLMPLDLSGSLMLFYLLYRAQLLYVATLGLPPESKAPYTDSQAFGAYMAVFAAAAWRLKAHLRAVVTSALSRTPTTNRRAPDSDEPVSYRAALAGFAACGTFILLFAVTAGMKLHIALIYFGILLALAIMITRIRAEFGFPVHDMHGMGPTPALVRTFGAGSFDKSTLGGFALMHWLTRAYRGHPMPHQLEALRAAGQERDARRGMFRAVLIAGLAAVPIGFAVYLAGFYQVGASTAHVNQWGTGYAREAFSQNLQTWLRSPSDPQPGDKIATVAGFVIATALGAARQRLPGFPLHPLAFAVANSWGMANLWTPILVGGACKLAVLRGRGLRGYRSALTFFYGLMLGEFAVGCSWTLLGMALNTPTYEFWP